MKSLLSLKTKIVPADRPLKTFQKLLVQIYLRKERPISVPHITKVGLLSLLKVIQTSCDKGNCFVL